MNNKTWKFTDLDGKEMCRLIYEERVPRRQVAEKFNCDITTVYYYTAKYKSMYIQQTAPSMMNFNRKKELKTLSQSQRDYWKMTHWIPQRYQKEMILDPARIKFGIMGRGNGKSETAKACVGGYVVNSHRHNRPYRILIVAPERGLTNIVWSRVKKDLCGDKIAGTYNSNGILPGLKVTKIEEPKNRDSQLTMENGTYIRTATGKNYLTLVGQEWDLIITDETGEFNRQSYMKMLGSLGRLQRLNHLFAVGTPSDFYQRLYQQAQNITSDKIRVWVISEKENKYKDEESLELLKLLMSEVEYKREFGAQFVAMEGQVYDSFREADPSKPIHDPHNLKSNTGDYPYDPALPTYFALDFGKTPICLVLQEDNSYTGKYFKDNKMWLQGRRMDYSKIKPAIYAIDEFNPSLSKGKFTIEAFSEAILALIDKYRKIDPQFLPKAIYGDPAGYNSHTSITSPLHDIQYLEQMVGLQILYQYYNAFTKINLGIKVVQSFIRNAYDNPYLFFDRTNCRTLIENIQGLRFPTDGAGRAISGATPLADNLHEHGCDALRYFFMNRPYGQFEALAILGQLERNKAGFEKMMASHEEKLNGKAEEEDSFICF